MNVLTDSIRADSEYSQLLSVLKNNFKDKPLPALAGGLCPGAADALCLALIEDTQKTRKTPALIICAEEKECVRLRNTFAKFGKRAAFYSSRDLNFHNISASHEYEHERLEVLSGILGGAYDVVLTTPDTALGYTMPVQMLKSNTVSVDYDTRIEPEVLAKKLVDAGYVRVEMVDGAGQFARRGGIVDLYPPFCRVLASDGSEYKGSYAIRIEFFDDEIDRMGIFDVDTQRLLISLEKLTFAPARELILDGDARERILRAVNSQIKVCHDPRSEEELLRERASLSSKETEIHFADKYISLVYPEKQTLLDYFDERSFVIIRNSGGVKDRLKADVWHKNQAIIDLIESGLISHKLAEYSKQASEFGAFCDNNVTLHVDSLAYGVSDKRLSGMFGFRTRQPVVYADNYNLLCEDIVAYMRSGYRVVIMAENEASAKNLCEILCDADFSAVVESKKGDVPISDIPKNVIYIKWRECLFGFELISPRIALLTTNTDARTGSLNAPSKTQRSRKKRRDGKAILSYAELNEGDIVVHETYGIGRYLGIEKLTIDGVTREYISIQYAGSDKLCMPVEKLDLVSKYIGAHSDDGLVKLSKMGGENWKKATARAKGAVKEMAKELIKLYAERMRKPGYSFLPDDEMQRSFEEAFDYDETECQLDAIEDIKQDMQRNVPMDRLLCGDVGYGKTEVAFRAAYKAVLSGKQVAILVPTTILALQHYQTAVSRMRNFAVNVDMISRFRTPKQQEQTLRRLARGDVDIIIGTHKLLGKDIKFRDLGLLIVDEEQRFGVAQKEKLKQLATNVDVLTLTATPIPRTLNMAMGGIRDMSILDEAPGDRLPVQTYVLEYDDIIITEAIKRELRRGGQVFFLHNFVESIDNVAARLAREIPEAKIAVAHGKMDKEQLEDIWSRMLTGEIDILVSTTIIETGIDIPNANTLIVDRADRLGLSQLHQLRGRVGRSSRRAYAYFTFPKDKSVSEIAQKRLEAVREYTEFGAGFRIALRDMEIRGAGNLLGAEQHGHLDAVGYDLYIKLLNDAVLEEKGEVKVEKKDCVVSFNYDAYLPEKYVKYPSQRMALYKRIALIQNEYDMDDIADELLDRFGELPYQVENLLRIALIRANAISFGIKQITQMGNEVRMYPDGFDMDLWSVMSHIAGSRLRVVMGQMGETYVVFRLKPGENATALINKLFEKYIETVQKTEKK